MANTVEARERLPALRASGIVASQADLSKLPFSPLEIQQNRIRELVDVSDAVANVIAGLAYGVADTWGAQA